MERFIVRCYCRLSNCDILKLLLIQLLPRDLGTALQVEAAVGINAGVQRAAKSISLLLQVHSTRFQHVDEAKCKGLSGPLVSYYSYRMLSAGTYVNNALDCTKDGSHGLANEWHSTEQPRFADQDVEKLLVNLDKLLND